MPSPRRAEAAARTSLRTPADGRHPLPDLGADHELVVRADGRCSHECKGLDHDVNPADR